MHECASRVYVNLTRRDHKLVIKHAMRACDVRVNMSIHNVVIACVRACNA